MKNYKFVLALCLISAISILTSNNSLLSQGKNTDDMKIVLEKVKADKKLLVSTNMELTEQEGKVFWPVYDEYQKDLGLLNDKYTQLILDYADAYNNNRVTNELAVQIMDRYRSVMSDESAMLDTYSKKLTDVLPAIKALRYIQMENKIRTAIKYELAVDIPLIK
jgi:5-hydroxyisourate hydrolase-like protein (transthyretin family)